MAFGALTTTVEPSEDRAALVVDSPARDLTLDHVRIVHSAHGGMSLRDASALARMTSTAFESNGGTSIELPADAVPLLAGNSFGEPARVMGVVTRTQSWPDDVPLVVAGMLGISAASTPELTLASGTTLRFSSNAWLSVGGPSGKGAIVARKVRFTAEDAKAKPGAWNGIDLSDSTASTILDGCTIELSSAAMAGPSAVLGALAPPPVVRVPFATKVTIVGTTFRSNDAPAFSGDSGCHGYDATKLHNVSIGQPLCAVDETLKALDALGLDSSENVFIGGTSGAIGDYGLGTGGTGTGGSGPGEGIGYGGATGKGGGGVAGPGAGTIAKPKDAGP